MAGLFAAGVALTVLLSSAMGVAGAKSGLQILIFAGVPLAVTAVLFPLFYRMNAHVVVSAAMLSCLAAILLIGILFIKNAALSESLAANPAVPVLERCAAPAGLLLLAGSCFISLRAYGSCGESGRKG